MVVGKTPQSKVTKEKYMNMGLEKDSARLACCPVHGGIWKNLFILEDIWIKYTPPNSSALELEFQVE